METQLDLFLDSQAVALANDAARAVAARDLERARAAVDRLRAEAGDHPCLGALETLASGLAAWDPPRAGAAAIANAADWLDRVVAPAAARALGEDAGGFLASLFRELADAARGVAYEPARPNAHRAWLCLRAGEWEEAECAAAAIPRPEANPDALHWRAVARYRRAGLEAAHPALFALAWGSAAALLAGACRVGGRATAARVGSIRKRGRMGEPGRNRTARLVPGLVPARASGRRDDI